MAPEKKTPCRHCEECVPRLEMAAIDNRKQGFFQRLSFGWMGKVASTSRQEQLRAKHLPLPIEQQAEPNFELFSKAWAEQLKKGAEGGKPASLFSALWKCYGGQLMLAGVFKLLWSFFVIMGAFFFVRSLLQYVDPKITDSPYKSDTAGYILIVGFFVDAWLLGLSLQRMGDLCLRVGIKIRASLVSAVSKKALSMESVSKEQSAEIVGFIATDINKVFDGIQQIHYLWTAPLEAATILALLTSLTKVYAVPGYVIVGCVLGLQYLFGYLTVKYKKANGPMAAARVALAQEVLPAMKLVKYYCWEKFFTKELSDMRSREQPNLWQLIIVRATNIALVSPPRP